MQFSEALEEMKQGRTIQRGCDDRTARFRFEDELIKKYEWENDWEGNIRHFLADENYQFETYELMADDWEVIID